MRLPCAYIHVRLCSCFILSSSSRKTFIRDDHIVDGDEKKRRVPPGWRMRTASINHVLAKPVYPSAPSQDAIPMPYGGSAITRSTDVSRIDFMPSTQLLWSTRGLRTTLRFLGATDGLNSCSLSDMSVVTNFEEVGRTAG